MAESTFFGRAAVPAILLVGLLSARSAFAEERAEDPALAHELFDQGRALMEKGDYDRACGKFEESRRLDPGGGGGGTLLNLALCEETRGRTGTAWALFREAKSAAVRDRREDRQQFAEEHIAALAPRLSRLRVVVPEAAVHPNLVVLRNGVALRQSEWGEALVVDPGKQVVQAGAPGFVTDRVVTEVHTEGDTVTVTVPALKRLPPETKKVQASGAKPPNVAEILVGGAGLTAMTIGGVFGLRAVNRQKDADALCPDYEHCDPRGITLSQDAAQDGRIAVGLFIGGTALLAGAVVVYLVTGRSHPPARSTGATLLSISF